MSKDPQIPQALQVPEKPIDFAKIFYALRKKLDLTQPEMAALMNCSYRSYCNYESGKQEPSGRAAFSLARKICEIRTQELKAKIAKSLTGQLNKIAADKEFGKW